MLSHPRAYPPQQQHGDYEYSEQLDGANGELDELIAGAVETIPDPIHESSACRRHEGELIMRRGRRAEHAAARHHSWAYVPATCVARQKRKSNGSDSGGVTLPICNGALARCPVPKLGHSRALNPDGAWVQMDARDC